MHPPRTRALATIKRTFLWQKTTRKVDKTGVIQLAGNRYEVELTLTGKRSNATMNPHSLATIHITYQGQDYADAVPLVLTLSGNCPSDLF